MPEDLEIRLDQIVERTGKSKADYVIEAVSEKLEDLEDLYIAEQRTLAHRAGLSRSYTQEEMEQRLGLGDLAD